MMKSITKKEYQKSYRNCIRYNARIKQNIDKTLEETDISEAALLSLKAQKIHTVKDLKKYYLKYGTKLFRLKNIGYYTEEYIHKLLK